MLEVFAHPDLPHQLVFVPVHPSQLPHMSKDVLEAVCQLWGEAAGLRGDIQLRVQRGGGGVSWVLSGPGGRWIAVCHGVSQGPGIQQDGATHLEGIHVS